MPSRKSGKPSSTKAEWTTSPASASSPCCTNKSESPVPSVLVPVPSDLQSEGAEYEDFQSDEKACSYLSHSRLATLRHTKRNIQADYKSLHLIPADSKSAETKRLGHENKSAFRLLLFCISLDLHYLCTRTLLKATTT